MGREDDMADTPRRGDMAASGGNSRGKRAQMSSSAALPPPPPSGGLKYDPTMASSSYASDRYAPYQHQPYMAEELTSNKRKRVKKERGEDDWMPAPPPPPPPSMMVAAHEMADPVAINMHMMPTILHRSSSSSAAHAAAAAAPPAPPAFVGAYASSSTTVFNEAPMEIRSFAETERRRQAASSSVAPPPSGALSHLVHAVDDTSAVVPPVPTVAKSSRSSSSNGMAMSWNSRGNGTMSVFDVFFPRHKSTSHTTTSSSSTSVPTVLRESKRRRRNQNGDATTSTRSSRRNNGALGSMAPESPTLDIMRFAVDSFKLIPQGLVDRIDHRLRPDFVVSLIGKHVDNWVKRAGFDDQNFLQEITTLLNAYYPCNYATILDDVLVGFVFKRPELMERMLKVMIERLQKTGESASPAKYPVIESFARRCGLQMASLRDQARHDLACLTVLRLLLERNTEKYLLSPWIASCASFCSDEVLGVVWEALLRPLVATGKSTSDKWDIREPLDQVFELLREEKQLTRYGESEIPRLSMTMIKKIVQDSSLAELNRVPVTCEAFEIFFGHAASHSTRFAEDWVAFEEKTSSREEAVAKVLDLTVENCVRLSVKKTNWFIRHILSVVVASDVLPTKLLESVVVQHTGLLLGGVEKHEMEELQPPEQSDAKTNGKKPSTVVVGKVSPNEKNIEAGIIAQLRLLLEFLRATPGDRGSSVVAIWSEQWCQSHVLVPWSYVWGMVSCALDVSEASSKVERAFLAFAARFVKRYVQGQLEHGHAKQFLSRVTRIVKALFKSSSSEACRRLFTSILDATSTASSKSVEAKRVWSLLATALADQLTVGGPLQKPDASPTRVDAVASPLPRRQVALLDMLHGLASQEDSVGRAVREELLVRRRIGMVVIEIIRQGDAAEAEAALKLLSVVLRASVPAIETRELCSVSVVESVVALAYRARVVATRRQAVAFLDNVSCSDSQRAKLLLWSLLRSCTSYCCGCSSSASQVVSVGHDRAEPASSFADLTKLVLQRSADDLVPQVGDFIQQHIVSCSAERGRWNQYLVLVLDRVVQLGWHRVASAPRVVHLILSPFGSVADSQFDRALQLRLLKSLCLVLLTAKSTKKTHKLHANAWEQAARLLASEQLVATLTRIGTQSSSATIAALSRSIAALCSQIKSSLGTSIVLP